MRKIKNFKINLRLREIQRRAKKEKLNIEDPLLADESRLEFFLSELGQGMAPAVVFDTFPPSSEASDVLAPVPGLAFSLAAVTLGETPSARLEAARSGGNTTEARLIEIAAEVGLEAAARFLLSILETEATLDRCELSPLQYLTEPQLIAGAAKLLDVSKIGVCPAAPETELAYPLRPSLSRLFSVSWISKSRTRRRPAQITI